MYARLGQHLVEQSYKNIFTMMVPVPILSGVEGNGPLFRDIPFDRVR